MKMTKSKDATERRQGLWLWGIVVLFLLVVAKWSLAELWYDEIMSLELFVLGAKSLGDVFRNYVAANNHFLSNAIEYVWLNLVVRDNISSELAVRLPSLACSVGTILTAGLCWRRHCGKRAALGAAMMLSVSPVFCSFAWQMRGYSLAMLLACLAVTAGADSLTGRTRRNQTVLALASLLLPLVMPTAVMLPLAIALAMTYSHLRTAWHDWRGAIRLSLLPFIGSMLGLSYYATLGDSLQKASQEAGGWTGFWRTLAAIILPMALHIIGYLILLPALWGKKPFAQEKASLSITKIDLYAQGLVLASLAAVLGALLLRLPFTYFPFPRTFLVLLPAVTFAAAQARGKAQWLDLRMTQTRELLLLAILGCVLIRATETVNSWSLRRARTRQNLLTQYYRGKDDNRQLAAYVAEHFQAEGRQCVWLTPDIDVVTGEYYCRLYDRQPDGSFLPVVLPVDRIHGPLPLSGSEYVLVSARTKVEAEAILAKIVPDDAHPRLEPLHKTEFRMLFSVIW